MKSSISTALSKVFDCPETETYLQDVVHLWFVHLGVILLDFFERADPIVEGES